MKKFSKIFLLFVVIVALFAVFCTTCTCFATVKNDPVLLSSQYGKVLKDGVQKVELYATYHNKGLYAHDIKIVVKDKHNDKQLFEITPQEDSGYFPAVLLADFTGDGVDEIYVGIDSGGSGAFGYYYIYSLVNGSVETLFDYSTLPNNYSAQYVDNYKVAVTNSVDNVVFNIDISQRDRQYLDGLYNSNGTLIRPTSADVSAVNTVYPYFFSTRNRFNILVLRRITGLYNADSLGYVMEYMTYNGNSFETLYSTVAVNGYNK